MHFDLPSGVLKQIVLLIGVAALSACGGGVPVTMSPDINDMSMDPKTPSTQLSITLVSLSTSTRSIFLDAGTFDTETDTVEIGVIRGTVNAARDRVALVGGGSVTLATSIDNGATRFASSPLSGTSSIGIVGYPTPLSEIPGSGTATFVGDTKVTAQIGSDLYELTGAAQLIASFGSGNATSLTLNNLSGQRFPALGAAENVTNVADLSLTNISVVGTGLAGGVSVATGGTITLSGSQNTTLAGQFYGANAAEAGGLFVIDDIGATGTIITGDFLVN